MVRILILFCFLFSGAWETSAQWAYKGLGGMATHQLTIQGDTIYASTSDGLYKKAMNSTDTLWEQVSFGGSMVLNTLFLDTGECLLLVAVNPSLHKAVLYKSADKGKTSTIFLPDTVRRCWPILTSMGT